MDVDELIKAVIDRFSPDELCDILGLTTEQMADKFYDEILNSEEIKDVLGLDEDEPDGLVF